MNLVNISQNPAPEGAVTGHIDGYDGKPIRYAYWKTPESEAKGTICLFSGRTEYIEKYFEVIKELLSRGFAVSVMDWRGQGGSVRLLKNPRLGHIKNFDDYEADAEIYLKLVVEPNCPRPYYALGHSMGGHMLLRLCALPDCPFEKAVLSSPMLGLAKETAPLSLPVLKTVTSVLKFFGQGNNYASGGSNELWDCRPFETNKITSDQNRYNRAKAIIEASPELGIADASVSWVNAASKSMLGIRKPEFLKRVKIPMLLLASGDDQIVDTPSVESIANQIPNATCKVILGARHELMMEHDGIRKQFWEAFDTFIPGNAASNTASNTASTTASTTASSTG